MTQSPNCGNITMILPVDELFCHSAIREELRITADSIYNACNDLTVIGASHGSSNRAHQAPRTAVYMMHR